MATSARIDEFRRDHDLREAEDTAREAIRANPADASLVVALGRVLLAAHREEDALETFTQAIASAPDDDGAVAWQIAALSRLCQFDDAVKTGTEALTRFPESTRVRIALGRAHLDASQPDTALTYLDDREPDDWRALVWRAAAFGCLREWDELRAVSSRLPDEARAHARLGGVLQNVERYEDALAHHEKAADLDPKCVLALEGRVSVLRNLYRYDEAESHVTAAIEEFPGRADLRVERALLLDARGCREEALDELARALETVPRHGRALRDRVSFLRRARRFAEAEAAAEAAVSMRPWDPDVHTARAWVFGDQDREDDALAAVDQALAIDPRHGWALRRRVSFLRGARRFAEAEAAAEAAVAMRPWDPDAHTARAWLLSDQDRHNEAVEITGPALAIDPRHSWTLRSRVTFLQSAGRLPEAEHAAREVIELLPWDPDSYTTAAWGHAEMGRYDEANTVVEQALAINPRNSRALRSRIEFLRRARRFAEAEETARQAVEVWPHDDGTHTRRAVLLQDMGRLDEALAAVDEALAIAPMSPSALRTRIDILMDARRFDEAERTARKAEEIHPHDVRVHVTTASLYSATGRAAEALAAVERALAIDPANEWALRRRITVLRDSRRYAEAEQAAQDAVAARPQDPTLRTARAWVLSAQSREDEAVEAVDEALALDPTDMWALRSRVTFLRHGCRYAEAERAANRVVELYPHDVGVRVTTAWVYSAMSRYDEAVAAVDEALRVDPRDSAALRARVAFLRNARRFPEAEAAAEQAVAAHPRDVDTRTSRAWVFSAQEREDEAIAAVDEALALDPRDEWALRSRVSFLQYARRFDEAEQTARTAIELRPRYYPAVHWAAASLYHATGRADDAVSAIDRALEIDPTDIWALRYRIDYLRAARRFTEAEKSAREGVQRHPRSPELCVAFAHLCADRDDLEGALTWFNRARDIDPYHTEALTGRVSTLIKLRRDSEADLAARDALQRLPHVISVQAELGRVQDHRFEFDAALETFSRALATEPDNVDLVLARSATLRSMRRGRDAERDVERLSRKFPHLRSPKVELGWIHHDERRYPQARAVFTELSGSAVNDEERAAAHHGLGWVAFSAGQYVRAEDEFRAACRERPDDFDYLLALAWALARQSGAQAQREAEEIATGLNARRAEPSVHVCLGVLAYRAGSLATAEYYLKKALDVDRYHGSHTDLGSLYLQMGRYEEAEAQLRSAIERDWYDVTSHVELGSLFLHTSQKRPAEAEREFRRALAVDPAAGFAAIGLAQALLEAGDSAEAESALRGVLARQDLDQRWRVHLALARLLVQAGEKQQNPDLHAEAYAEAQRAIALAPDAESDPHFVAGVAHHRMGSIAADARGRFGYRRRALHHLRECLKREPGHVEAQRNVQLLEREMKAVAPAVWGGYAVAGISFALLATLWTTFFFTDKVTALVLTTTTPVLVGLFTIAVLLPALIRLKLPGFEADLQAGANAISPGPTGEVTFGPGRFTVSTGPTGQLPRLE